MFTSTKKATKLNRTFKLIRKDKSLLILMIPATIWYFIFHYLTMAGVLIAFQDFSPTKGIFGSEFVGMKYFIDFFSSNYFYRIFRNTILLNLYGLIWGFPVPILFAILLNEVKNGLFKRAVQTVSYLPHFISIVVICGMLVNMLSVDGVIYNLISYISGSRSPILTNPKWFRTIFVSSGIWQSFGWGSIIYLAAMASINPELYEASYIDGAGRWRRIWNITIPGIQSTIIILLILNIGNLLRSSFEKVYLLYSPATYETADVISTYVYRAGILGAQYSYSTAVDFFNSVVNVLFLVAANYISKRYSETSLW
jgi:putative aldouronate transport system permease protein